MKKYIITHANGVSTVRAKNSAEAKKIFHAKIHGTIKKIRVSKKKKKKD